VRPLLPLFPVCLAGDWPGRVEQQIEAGVDLVTCAPWKVGEPPAAEVVVRLMAVTDLPVKVILPGPSHLTRMLAEQSDQVVARLQEEARALCRLGVAMIQFDEPRLEEPAVPLINRITDLIHELSAARTVLRVPRQAGGYRPLEPVLARIRVSQLVLDSSVSDLSDLPRFDNKELGLGVGDPREEAVEAVGEIVSRVARVLEHCPTEKLFLCLAGTPVSPARLRALVEAARELRRRHASPTPAA
jgi:methionine synthase II (cobalamin-independent)